MWGTDAPKPPGLVCGLQRHQAVGRGTKLLGSGSALRHKQSPSAGKRAAVFQNVCRHLGSCISFREKK